MGSLTPEKPARDWEEFALRGQLVALILCQFHQFLTFDFAISLARAAELDQITFDVAKYRWPSKETFT